MAKEDENQWIREEFAEVKTALVRIDEAIRGNGKEGLMIRVAKNEMRHKLLFWITTTIVLAVIGIGAKLIFEHLSH